MSTPTTTEYALCWEAPGDGEDAWVIRVRSPKFPEWDRMFYHPTLGEDDVSEAKAWAAARLAADGFPVGGWHRDHYGNLIPESA